MNFELLVGMQVILIAAAGLWMLKRNDEIPILIATICFCFASYRYWAVSTGIGNWINPSQYTAPITNAEALEAIVDIVFGEFCLITAYCYKQKIRIRPAKNSAEQSAVLKQLSKRIILLGLCIAPLVIFTRLEAADQILAGQSMALGNGYLFLFPMALVGIGVLVVWLWKFGGLQSLGSKVAALVIFITIAKLSFNPTTRFQFLGWIVASAVILSSAQRPKARILIMTAFFSIGIVAFSIAGSLRNPENIGDALKENTLQRAAGAEDANMLDGLVMLKRVYPKALGFRFGMEHLEILSRPIPRKLWPGKPIGGAYSTYLGYTDVGSGETTGFSPTLFGSFYAEGGRIGILIFSILYGFMLAKVIRLSSVAAPSAGALIRAVICAALVPLLRGGDLPGNYALLGMSFWPCFLFLWWKRRVLFPLRESIRRVN